MENSVVNICPFNCPSLECGYNFIKCKEINQYLKFCERPFGAIRANDCPLFFNNSIEGS